MTMPYIKQEDRQYMDKMLDPMLTFINCANGPLTPGEMNYFISSVVWALFDRKPSYTTANELVGVLECAKQEFIRRKLGPYEDVKLKESGDL